MGYYTHISGEMRIEPALQSWPATYDDENETYFRLTSSPGDETVKVVNGALTVVQSNGGFTAVELNFEDSIKGYDFHERVQELADLAASQGCKMSGFFDGDGESSDDFWRLTAKDNVLSSEVAEIVFPSTRYNAILAIGQSGHGHAVPRADGVTVACGGVTSCSKCIAEHRALRKALHG